MLNFMQLQDVSVTCMAPEGGAAKFTVSGLSAGVCTRASQSSKSTLPPLWVFNIWHHTTLFQSPSVCFHRAESVFLDTGFNRQPCRQSAFCLSMLDVTPSEQQHSAGKLLLRLTRRSSPFIGCPVRCRNAAGAEQTGSHTLRC